MNAQKRPTSVGMRIDRRFTAEQHDGFSGVEWSRRTSRISNPDGSVVFEMADAEVPADWSQVASDIMISKYFRKAGVPQFDDAGNPILDESGKPVLGPERSARQVISRLTGVQVLGSGSFAPPHAITNEELAPLGYDAEWIVQRTGILARRRAADDMACSDLAYEAATRCLDQAGVRAEELDLIVVARGDFLLGRFERVLVRDIGPDRTADQVPGIGRLVIGLVLGKRSKCTPERSVGHVAVGVLAQFTEPEHDLEIVQRVAAEVEFVGEGAFEGPHEVWTDLSEQSLLILLRNGG